MSAFNTDHTYGSVTRVIHWGMALLVTAMIPLGLRANHLAHQIADGATDPAILSQAQLLFSLHKTLGVGIFFLALIRIVWALRSPKPKPLLRHKPAETFLASMVHWLLYTSLLLVPLTGWIHHAATTGIAPIWWPFGQSLPFVPKDPSTAETFATLHIILQRLFAISILLHLAGALKHHFFDQGATLKRMWNGAPGQINAGHNASQYAPLAAFVASVIALGTGAALGLFDRNQTQTVALQPVSSEWTVTEGTLAISNTQLGAEVQGSFADWTSSISFDPDLTEGVMGEVTTVISIGSLTLGSVTAHAMGPDYFNVAAFPTATYNGTLIRDEDGLRSEGMLRIKDTRVPVSFAFDLSFDGNRAKMTGMTTLNRFDFEMGSGIDENTLAAEVILTMTLTATRATDPHF
ncbi:MAG: cytochrome b/b6 domain-containing protein [Paracoccaceae bacterium]|uniref:cytochrome b/b6 domain-containing protein n=1 Tax=Tateyamaria sp. TaxID=1929288 RepID=UPI0032686CB5